ncbi:uncharacterized protein LOC117122862 [Anneissia japonica]|uniref:uncharacterized protein LOC117122862 n=1 Tax=Anneissia japonica TaxID=1529436 RepID=UPI001425A75D|nr:uncharacterized protein LOC117122862 [Anneissia japonica]XP_033124515.1 uncharacterized protein LOC117122862 [Anneissia japonica]XP_033124516.1 uncharacterized protein LOC117122862 [Anneissia japonica]
MKIIIAITFVIMAPMCRSEQEQCCRAMVRQCYPRPELNPDQLKTLRTLADELEKLPCDQRIERIYNTTESPITYTEEQMEYLTMRYATRFEASPPEQTECFDNSSSVSMRRRRATPGTRVCSTIVDAFTTPHLALDRRGQIVLVPQGIDRVDRRTGVRFKTNQYVFETICQSRTCLGVPCNCATISRPSAIAIVHYIRGGTSLFIEDVIQARTCYAFT